MAGQADNEMASVCAALAWPDSWTQAVLALGKELRRAFERIDELEAEIERLRHELSDNQDT